MNDTVSPCGPSGQCNINAPACPQSRQWLSQVRSVVIMMTADGQKFCSGAMLNNLAQDGKQYFLTAHHCIDDGPFNHAWDILGFNYQSQTCANNNQNWPLTQTAQGLTFKATWENSDFALFELQEMIPATYNVYMAGWNVQNQTYSQVQAIHHPSGDVKKISFYQQELQRFCWGECPAQLHLKVTAWTQGTTEPGSSGSPLFNNKGQVIGQLHGGTAACGNRGFDVFGALWASYLGTGIRGYRLFDYLNPRLIRSVMECPGANLNDIRKWRRRNIEEEAVSEMRVETDLVYDRFAPYYDSA